MTKTQQLDALFEEWKNKIYSDQNIFIRDGIINENEWNKTDKKILFICKEANNKSEESWDFRGWWSKSINYTFAYRIAEWSSGILQNFPSFDSINDNEKKFDAIQQIAILNVNKTGGKATSKDANLKIHIEESKKFILKQIEIIEPNIIISCIGDELNDFLFSDEKWSQSGYAILVKRYGNAKLISFVHPSSRSYSSAPYCLLKTVTETEVFQNL